MANKKISELESRASLSLSDLMAVGDPSTGYLYKTTISDLKTLTGAGVVSFNGRFGTVNPAEGDYTLTQLGDVIITSPSNGQVLKYNGSNWVNATEVSEADTLDTVTGRGNTTANSITVGSVSAAGLSNLLGQIRTFATTGNIYMGANPGSATDAGFKLDVLGTTRLNGNTTVTGVLTGSDTIRSTNGTVTVSISYGSTAGIIGTTSNHSLEIRTNNTYRVGVSTAGVVNIANLIGTGSRIVVADAAGNLSATTAIGDFVTINTTQTITGAKTFNNLTTFNQNIVGGIIKLSQGVLLSKSAAVGTDAGFLSLIATSATGLNYINIADGDAPSNTQRFAVPNTGTYTYTFPAASGTVALTSDIPSVAGVYLPLAGGTLTGALNGTSATFSGQLILNASNNQVRSGNELRFYRADNAAYTELYDAGSLAANGFVLNNTNGEGFHFKNGSTTIMRMNSSGNVGINTTNPGRTLHVLGQTGIGTILKLEGAAGTTTYLQMSYNGATNAQSGYIGYDSSANMSFFTNDTQRLTISSTGAATFSSSVTANGLYANAGNSARFYRGNNDYYWSIHNDSNNYLNFGTYAANGTAYGTNPKMILLDNGFVGIGTTNPTGELHVYGSTTAFRIQSSVSGNMQFGQWDGSTNRIQSSGRDFYLIGTDAYSTIFGTNGTARLWLNASGNLGLGVTPSAWVAASGRTAMQVGITSVSTNVANDSFFGTNYYDDGSNNRYINSDFALIYAQQSGSHIWYSAPSGTAGAAIGFTAAMTLNQNGRLLLGLTSDFGYLLSVNGTAYIQGTMLVGGAATFSSDVKVKTLEVTNVGTDATSSGVSTYMRITVNGQNYLIPLHGTP